MSDRFELDKRELDRWITREDTGHYPQCEECPVDESCEATPGSEECKKRAEEAARKAAKDAGEMFRRKDPHRGCCKSSYGPDGCPLHGGPECPATCWAFDELRCDDGNSNCTPAKCYDCLKNPDNAGGPIPC